MGNEYTGIKCRWKVGVVEHFLSHYIMKSFFPSHHWWLAQMVPFEKYHVYFHLFPSFDRHPFFAFPFSGVAQQMKGNWRGWLVGIRVDTGKQQPRRADLSHSRWVIDKILSRPSLRSVYSHQPSAMWLSRPQRGIGTKSPWFIRPSRPSCPMDQV